MNEQGAIHNDGAVPNDGAAPNDGDVVIDQEELMPHPGNYQVDKYAQMLVSVQGLKDVVGEYQIVVDTN